MFIYYLYNYLYKWNESEKIATSDGAYDCD